MSLKVWTVGHSTRGREEFLAVLAAPRPAPPARLVRGELTYHDGPGEDAR